MSEYSEFLELLAVIRRRAQTLLTWHEGSTPEMDESLARLKKIATAEREPLTAQIARAQEEAERKLEQSKNRRAELEELMAKGYGYDEWTKSMTELLHHRQNLLNRIADRVHLGQ